MREKKFYTFKNKINILNEDRLARLTNVHIELSVFQVLHGLWFAYWIKRFLH